MAHSKSARKRIRQNAHTRLRNRAAKSALRTTVKKFLSALTAGDKDAATTALVAVQERADKTAAKGIIRKKSADRIKSHLSARLKKLAAVRKEPEA